MKKLFYLALFFSCQNDQTESANPTTTISGVVARLSVAVSCPTYLKKIEIEAFIKSEVNTFSKRKTNTCY
jgi:hypothetical protein